MRIEYLPYIAILGWSQSAMPAAAQQYEHPFQNPNLSVEERVSDFLSVMTNDEKIAALVNPAVERLKIPAYGTSEGIHQVVLPGRQR
jgi:beta-glucosidase